MKSVRSNRSTLRVRRADQAAIETHILGATGPQAVRGAGNAGRVVASVGKDDLPRSEGEVGQGVDVLHRPAASKRAGGRNRR